MNLCTLNTKYKKDAKKELASSTEKRFLRTVRSSFNTASPESQEVLLLEEKEPSHRVKTCSVRKRRTKAALVDGDEEDDVINVLIPEPKGKKLTVAWRAVARRASGIEKRKKNFGPMEGSVKKQGVKETKEGGDFDDSQQTEVPKSAVVAPTFQEGVSSEWIMNEGCRLCSGITRGKVLT